LRHVIFAGLLGVTAVACAPESTGDEPLVVLPQADVAPEPEPDSGPLPDAESAPDAAPESVGLAVLGAGAHTIDAVELTIIGTAADGLAVPRDLDFDHNAESPTLWVVNRADDSTTTFFDPGTDAQDAVHIIDPYALHFMEEVSSIAFGQPGTFGTCQESRNTYNGQGEANDFMGPSLWPSDLNVYGRTNPDAVAFLGFDLGSHLDMQHESPLCMGIAWQRDNIYWVFEGMTSSIARNDFGEDHGAGYDDHSDGIVIRFAVGEVARVPDVPSHLVFDHDSGLLYIADTGNARVGSLDTREGTPGVNMPVVEPGTILRLAADGAPVETVFGHADLKRPSGLALHEGVLYVGDNLTGRIWGLDLDGEVIDYLDTELPPGALMGLDVGPDGALWVTDAVDHRVLRIAPQL